VRALVVAAVAVAAAGWCGDAWAPPREADLRATVAADRPSPAEGQVAIFTVAVRNAGPDSALDVVVRDVLPDGATLLRAVPSQGACAGAAPVTCNLGTLGRGNLAHDARASVRVFARVDTSGSLTDVADVSSSSLALEIAPENNHASATVTATPFTGPRPSADLVLAALPKRKVRVTNLGPDAASGVVVGKARVGFLPLGGARVVAAAPGLVAVRSATPDPDPLNDRVRLR
jgi:uncharacterized repeat protein (TIGR01451 family)